MSDKHLALPVRTEADGTDQRMHVKIVDFAAPAGANNQTEVSEKLLHIRAFGQDPSSTKVQLKLSELGYANTDGIYDGTNNTLPSTNGLIAHVRNASPAATQQTERITSIENGDGDVRALDVAIRDEAGEPFGPDNPLPVEFRDTSGDEIFNYHYKENLAAAAVENHDYTVTALKFLEFYGAYVAGSGKLRADLQVETAPSSGTFTTICVQFNSVANPNIFFDFQKVGMDVAAGVKIRLAILNRDNQAQDTYSTIIGVENVA